MFNTINIIQLYFPCLFSFFELDPVNHYRYSLAFYIYITIIHKVTFFIKNINIKK